MRTWLPVLLLGAAAGFIGDAGRWIFATAESARALPWAPSGTPPHEGTVLLARTLPALLGMGLAWAAFAVPGWKQRLFLLLGALGLTLTGSASLSAQGVLWDPFPCALAVIFGWLAGLTLARTKLASTSEIARYFQGRMSPERLRHWLRATPAPNLRCENRPATILTVHFLHEAQALRAIGPAAFLHITDDLANRALQIGLKHGGLQENSPRDLVRLVFGLPEPEPGDARTALTAACEIQAALTETLNARDPRLPLGFGIGLASGNLASGAVADRYQIVGEAISSSRLLANSGTAWHASLLCDQATLDQAGEPITARPLGLVTVPDLGDVDAWEVLSLEAAPDPSLTTRTSHFTAAMESLRQGETSEALTRFFEARSAGGEDDPVIAHFIATTQILADKMTGSIRREPPLDPSPAAPPAPAPRRTAKKSKARTR